MTLKRLCEWVNMTLETTLRMVHMTFKTALTALLRMVVCTRTVILMATNYVIANAIHQCVMSVRFDLEKDLDSIDFHQWVPEHIDRVIRWSRRSPDALNQAVCEIDSEIGVQLRRLDDRPDDPEWVKEVALRARATMILKDRIVPPAPRWYRDTDGGIVPM